MCLTIDEHATQELRNCGQEYVIRYKILYKREDIFHSPYYTRFRWSEGWNVAKKYDFVLEKEPGKVYDNAIHVFVDEIDAKNFAGDSSEIVVIPVKCYIEDFVAAGYFCCDLGNCASEAYERVYVDKL